jgi:hypothetical protein
MDIFPPALASTPPVAGQPAPEFAPVTYQQEWIWNLLVGENPLNFIARTYAWRLRGFIDVEVMRSCVEAMSKKHALLRTGIAIDMGAPQLHMHASNECRLEIVDLYRAERSDAENEVRRLLEGLAYRNPVLPARSSFELRVLAMEECDHVLAVTMHHMFTDLTSLRLLLEELWHRYTDLLHNRAPAFQSVQMQYHEYAAWQRSTHHHWLATHEDYWRTKLSGAKRFRLPVDSELARGVAANSLAELKESFGPALTSAIVAVARRERTMTPMVILASYAVVIGCWSDQRNLAIPFNVSGRHLPMHEAMLGPLGQMLFITIELSGAESLCDVLRAIGQEFSLAHEHLDFAKISIRHPELLESGFLQYLSWNPAELAGLLERKRDKHAHHIKAERFIFNE